MAATVTRMRAMPVVFATDQVDFKPQNVPVIICHQRIFCLCVGLQERSCWRTVKEVFLDAEGLLDSQCSCVLHVHCVDVSVSSQGAKVHVDTPSEALEQEHGAVSGSCCFSGP